MACLGVVRKLAAAFGRMREELRGGL